MSGFLLNMIHRHQGTVNTVQPRIRSMFEPESSHPINKENFANTTNEAIKESFDTKVERQFGFVQPSNQEKHAPGHPPIVPKSSELQQTSQLDVNFKTPGQESFESNRLNLMNDQIQAVLVRLGQKPESKEAINEHYHQNIVLPLDTSTQITSKANPETTFPEGIEETLSRLKNQINRVAQTKHELQTHGFLTIVDTQKSEVDQLIPPLTWRETKDENPLETLGNTTKHPDPTKTITAPTNQQAGSLLVPAWLTTLQAQLNSRWSELNTSPNSGRIVNVTIGRVEVRATNPSSNQQHPASEKPKGVLSLDEYLKQRDSKGRS